MAIHVLARHSTGGEAFGVWMRRVGGQMEVAAHHPVPWSSWGIRPQKNHGVEGVCADQTVWAAGEPVISEGGHRYAPLLRWDAKAERWQLHRLRLTTDTGKDLGAVVWRGAGDGH